MIERVRWSDEVTAALLPALEADLNAVRQEVAEGVAALYRISDQHSKGYFVTRLETLKNGSAELVLVACGGRGYIHAMKTIIDRMSSRVDSLRSHAKRKGIKKWLEKLGFKLVDRSGEYYEYRFYCG